MLDLRFDFSDINGYVDMLNSSNSWDELPLFSTMDDTFYNACEKYLTTRINRVKLLRCFTVRCFYSHIQRCFANRIKVKVYPFRRGYGYMLDRGEVHILADLLFKAPHMRYISVLFHETAHVALSQCDSYDELLQLDILFAEKYLKNQYNGLLKTVTPVEFLAQLLANQWMRRVAEQISDPRLKESVGKEIDWMHSKLLLAVDTLNEIRINTLNHT
jgi:hypothetical protein